MQSLCLLAALAPQLVCAADPSLACTPKQCDLYSVIYNETVSKLCSITPQTAHHAPQFELCRMHAAYHLTQRSVQLGVRRQGVRALTQNMTGDASLSPHCFAVTMTTRTTSSFAYRSFSPRLSPSTRAWVPLSPLHLAGSQSNPSSTGRIARGDPRSMRSSPTHPRDGVDEEPLWTCHSCV